jgi:N-acetylmuramoyl-L-alanine amidase
MTRMLRRMSGGLSRFMLRLGRACVAAGFLSACLAGASGFALAEGGASAPTERQGVILGVEPRLEPRGSGVRFSITVSAPVKARFVALSDPLRLVADLDEVNFQAMAAPARRGGSAASAVSPVAALVAGFRAGLVAPGRSRMVFDLAQPARVVSSELRMRGPGLHEWTIDFEPVPRSAFDAAVREGAAERARDALAPLQPSPANPAETRPLVVIDPGHGGIDPGAVAGPVMEKNLVLAIGRQLRDALEASGRVRVLMTRSDDRFLSLSERVRVAREANASLFVSLHADSLSAAQEVRGATIYTGSERATDAESARLAQKENAADAVGGAETTEPQEEVADILMDLARRETRVLSQAIAARLVTEMSGAVRMHRIPQRSAGFRVLTAPDVPSILLELGYMSSRDDIALMTSPAWQRTAAEAIARAVDRHFEAQSGGTGRRASISP